MSFFISFYFKMAFLDGSLKNSIFIDDNDNENKNEDENENAFRNIAENANNYFTNKAENEIENG